jgi:hypothetical protein
MIAADEAWAGEPATRPPAADRTRPAWVDRIWLAVTVGIVLALVIGALSVSANPGCGGSG